MILSRMDAWKKLKDSPYKIKCIENVMAYNLKQGWGHGEFMMKEYNRLKGIYS